MSSESECRCHRGLIWHVSIIEKKVQTKPANDLFLLLVVSLLLVCSKHKPLPDTTNSPRSHTFLPVSEEEL